jgi:hypothetical protein
MSLPLATAPIQPSPRVRSAVSLLAALGLLHGCAAFRSYDQEMRETLTRASAGDIPGAIKVVERFNKGGDKDLLYYLEMGELRRLENDFEGSRKAFLEADQEVETWETAAWGNVERGTGALASYVLNDKLRVYEGRDYEKVMLTTRLAMNHLLSGDWDNARVQIKRTHEREAFIEQVRADEYLKVKEEARENGARIDFREIDGYPVQTIDNPAVNALKNGYQNALSHYLAGFVYEALGETSLAAPGYRTAIELRPPQPLLDDALAGLDARIGAPDDGTCDTLFVIETGTIPGRVSQGFSLPIPIAGEWVIVAISFPVLPPAPGTYQAPSVRVDKTVDLETAHILDLDVMARRALKDEMPGLMLRAFARSITKATAQYQLQRQMRDSRGGRNDAQLGMALGLLALQIGTLVTETADERGWRTLPAQVSLARARLPRGQHGVEIVTDAGAARFDVNLAARHALVSVRLLRGASFVSPAGSPGMPVAPPGAQSAERPGTRQDDDVRVSVVNFAFPSNSSPARRPHP